MKFIFAAPAVFIFALSACASSNKPEARSPTAGLEQSQRLLARAREIQAERGCAAAIPTYRVISSFGDGYEVAQYELGACLLKISGVSTDEAALFHEESIFWLKRAAWAGNARAQFKLAHLLSGDPSEPLAAANSVPADAMGWALVYHANSTRDLFGLPRVASSVLAHLNATLSTGAMNKATAFAASFDEIKMASYTPPPSSRQAGNKQGQPHQGQPKGQGKRRPR